MLRISPWVLSWLIASALVVGIAQSAAAELRHSVSVSGPIVVLGDIFTNAGTAASVEVMRAPAPGDQRVLNTRQIGRLAHAHGIDWSPIIGDESVTINRRGRAIERDEIARPIADALAEIDGRGSLEIELSGHIPVTYVPVDQEPLVEVGELDLDARSSRFSATMVITTGAEQPKRLRIAGRAYHTEQVPVLVRRIGSGETIRANDVVWRSIRGTRLRGDFIGHADELVGRVARRPLQPEAPLRQKDVERPAVIKKGFAVTMVYRVPGLVLTAVGQAMEDGTDGQPIRIMNVQSKSIVHAIVTGPDTVLVQHNKQIALN